MEAERIVFAVLGGLIGWVFYDDFLRAIRWVQGFFKD